MSYVKRNSTVVRVPGHVPEIRYMGFHPVEIGHGWVVLRRVGDRWVPLTFTFARTRPAAIATYNAASAPVYAEARRLGRARVVRCVLQPVFPPLEKERK